MSAMLNCLERPITFFDFHRGAGHTLSIKLLSEKFNRLETNNQTFGEALGQ